MEGRNLVARRRGHRRLVMTARPLLPHGWRPRLALQKPHSHVCTPVTADQSFTPQQDQTHEPQPLTGPEPRVANLDRREPDEPNIYCPQTTARGGPPLMIHTTPPSPTYSEKPAPYSIRIASSSRPSSRSLSTRPVLCLGMPAMCTAAVRQLGNQPAQPGSLTLVHLCPFPIRSGS